MTLFVWFVRYLLHLRENVVIILTVRTMGGGKCLLKLLFIV